MTQQFEGLPTNPDELPTDPVEIEKMLAGEEGEATDVKGSSEDEGASSGAAGEEQAAAGTQAAGEPGQEGEPHEDKQVPIGALYKEREKARREREAREQAEQMLAGLQERIAALEAGRDTQGQSSSEIVSDEDLEALQGEFPAMAKVLEGMLQRSKFLEEQLQTVTARERQREEATIEDVRTETQKLIDANPVLSYWQNEDPEMFQRAVELDDRLKVDPKMKGIPLADRFAKVVTSMEAIYGPTELPTEYQPAKPQASAKDLQERAEKAVKDAGSFEPRTLSDLPGGTPPPSSDTERIAEMPVHALGAMFMDMTPEQMEATLSKFG